MDSLFNINEMVEELSSQKSIAQIIPGTVGGGTTITTTTNGSVGGSSLQINYNAYINSPTNYQYNCVELWRSGGSAYYSKTFNIVRSSYAYPAGSAAIVNGGDIFSIPGNAGSYYQGNIGNIKSSIKCCFFSVYFKLFGMVKTVNVNSKRNSGMCLRASS